MQGAPVVRAVCLLLWGAAFTRSSTPNQCDSSNPLNFKFSVFSRRNQSGHWIAQGMLQHRGIEVEDLHGARSWGMDIDHSVSICDGVKTVTVVATVTAPPRIPGPNYELVYGLGYYKLHTETKNWQDARRACVLEGAHLAIINSEREEKELKAIFARHPKINSGWKNDVVYIGINSIRKRGEWVTIFDEPLNATGHVNWNAGESDAPESRRCGMVARNGRMHDVDCAQQVGFFCEQEL